MVVFYWKYMRTSRAVFKYIQVLLGTIVCFMFCFKPIGGDICMENAPLAYNTWLNFTVALLNVAWFFAYLIDEVNIYLERIYMTVISVLFLVDFCIVIWLRIIDLFGGDRIILAAILILIQLLFYLVEFKYLERLDVSTI